MKLIYKGTYNLDPESLPAKEHQPGAVKFNEFDDSKAMGIVASVMAIVVILILGIIMIFRAETWRFSYWGCLCSLLILFPHELLHAICFKEEVSLYTNWKQGMLFVVGPETMSRKRFVVMSLLPNILFGLIPYVIFMIYPNQMFFGTLGTLALGMGVGDYYNVFNALTQMPKGARTYLHHFNSYWYIPEQAEEDKKQGEEE